MRNANNGGLTLVAVINGAASYTQVGGVGSEWNFRIGTATLG